LKRRINEIMAIHIAEQYLKREVIDDKEQQELKDNCKTFFEKFVINILLETGLRVDEFIRICTKNYMEMQRSNKDFNHQDYNIIDWQSNHIIVYGKMPRQKKGEGLRKRRVVPLSSTCKNYLQKYFDIEENTHIDYTIQGIWTITKRIARKADIKKNVSPHVLRHTFAVNYLNRGGDIAKLKQILGHASLSTTGIYLTYTSKHLQKEFSDVMG